jgi:hypothetical protein
MDHRILIAAIVGLVFMACGGFYYALSVRSYVPVAAPAIPADIDAAKAPGQPAQMPAATPARGAPGKATTASIEAEIARSEHAELQALLMQRFPEDYKQMIELAVRRRNEGISDEAFGRELFTQIQAIMRSKLKFAAGADIAIIDKLAANEIELFHALANDGAPFCLSVLGRTTAPQTGALPDDIRRFLRLGTLYRFQAIANGMPNFKPIEPLKQPELVGLQAALVSNGMNFDDVRSGAFLNQEGDEPGKPCMMIERLYRTITGLGDETRRKLYSGMFFLGRDR